MAPPVKQEMDLDAPPGNSVPEWGRRVHFHNFFVDLCPAAPRTLNLSLSTNLATISFDNDEGLSSLAGDRLRPYERSPYEYIVVPPKFPVRGKSDSAPEVLCLAYSFNDLKQEVAEALQISEDLLEARVIIGGPKPFTTEIAQRIRRHILKDPKPNQYLRSLCIVLIVEMMRLPPERLRTGRSAALEDRVLQMVLGYIDANLDGDLSLEALSSLAGVLDNKFARSFKKKTGESLHRYVMARRIRAARDLLEKSQDSISDVAYATGFSSQSHMTTAFKRDLGITPAQVQSDANAPDQ
jgi:AraC family transcriptional regulator